MSTPRRKRPTKAESERAATAWNAAHPIGASVSYWTGLRHGDGKYGVTRSEAFVDDAGTAVVFLEGVSGYVALSHVEAKK